MDIHELLDKTKGLFPRPICRCADGFEISVQAGKWYGSVPNEDVQEYLMVELGFPSEDSDIRRDNEIELLSTNDVMGYVPIERVQELLDTHGGIDKKYMDKHLMMKELVK